MAEFTDELELQINENTTKVGITPEQAGDILTNNEKLSYLLGFTQQQAEDILANNEKVSAIFQLTQDQVDEIAVNSQKVSYTDAELVQELANKMESTTGQTEEIQGALDAASSPSVANPFTTVAQLNALGAHAGSTDNPHQVNKTQVGLGNVDNSADADKPVSTPVAAALALKADASRVLTQVPAGAVFTDTSYTHPATHPPSIIEQDASNRFMTDTEKANLGQNTAHRGSTGNPHNVTVGQTGGLTPLEVTAAVAVHGDKTANPHQVTKLQVGLGLVDNTADADKPVSGPVTTALALKADLTRVLTPVPILAKFTDTVYEHPAQHPGTIILQDSDYQFVSAQQKTEYNSSYVHSQLIDTNPHQVTKAQLGLELVDNTADADKPVSTDQQAAIDEAVGDFEAADVEAMTTIAISMAIALG